MAAAAAGAGGGGAVIDPVHVDVAKHLHKVIKNAGKKDVDVKTSAQKAADVLKDFLPLKDPETELVQPDFEKNFHLVLAPFIQSIDVQSKSLKPSVAILQRLVASGFLRGSLAAPSSGGGGGGGGATTATPTPPPSTAASSSSSSTAPDSSPQIRSTPAPVTGATTATTKSTALTKIIEKVCKCTDADEAALITIVKFLQVCCVTPMCELRGPILLAAVKACFQIFTNARPKTQIFASAKDAITDIINYLFQRIKTTKRFLRGSLSIANINELLPQQQQQLAQQEHQQQTLLLKNDEKPDRLKRTMSMPAEYRPADKHRIVAEILNGIIESVVNSGVSISGPHKEGNIVEDVMFHDFCMIFSYVCQVSTETPKPAPREFHGKLLALQILHTIISNSAATLSTSRKFVNEMLRVDLVGALMGNGNTTGKLFQYVLSIFLDLLQNFREYLKDEVGLFFSKVLLPRMETTSASQELYWVLQVFSQFCKDGTILLDLFVNYDCDEDQDNVFQRSVESLCKATGQPLAAGQRFISNQHYSDFQIRTLGLKSIVQLTKSLGDWRDSDKGQMTMDAIVERRERKKTLEHARHLFADSARKGVDALAEMGVLVKTPQDIARYLRSAKGLDKASIGDYISKRDNGELLAAYLALFDFTDMEFDMALRHLLSTFRLPGESRPIEIIVQAFANKYFEDNKHTHIFAGPDAAFVLAYSTIMLATDQHNPNVKNRMTFAAWAKNNRQINDGKDFDETFMQGIFDRISKTPLKLQNSSGPTTTTSTPSSSSPAASSWSSDDGLPSKGSLFTTCYRQSLVKWMMQSSWQYIAETFEFCMTNCDDAAITELCLTGYQNAVHISGVFELEASRAKFLESAVSFAKIANVREITKKEVDSIRCLSIIFLFDGDYLGVDWLQILRCLSYLAQLFRLGSTPEIQDPTIENSVLEGQKNELRAFKENRQVPEVPKQADGTAMLFEAQNVVAIMKQMCINSTLLPEEQLIFFTEALCKVSHDEVFGGAAAGSGSGAGAGPGAGSQPSSPSVFSLQKLVDVAYYNLLCRSGPVWSRVWLIMSAHFIKVGTSEHSLAVRKTALDSLDYLLNHFFELDPPDVNELFYKDLFFPFDRIIRLCPDHTTRSLQKYTSPLSNTILQYVAQIVGNHFGKIRSGWKTIFSVFTWAANCNEVLVEMGLASVEDILREYFPNFAAQYFVEFVNCMSAFANSKLPNISVRAIDAISSCAVHLANGRVYPVTTREVLLQSSGGGVTASSQVMFTDEQEHLVLWMPVLTALSDVLSSHDLTTVRLCALNTLEQVLVLFGSMFSPKLWEMIFRGVLLPIFNNIGYSKGRIRFPDESQEWLSTTCPHAFRLLMDIFTNFVETIDFLSAEILQLLASCVLQVESEELLRLGSQSLLRFTTTNGNKLSAQVWDLVAGKMEFIIGQVAADQASILTSLLSAPAPLATLSTSASSSGSGSGSGSSLAFVRTPTKGAGLAAAPAAAAATLPAPFVVPQGAGGGGGGGGSGSATGSPAPRRPLAMSLSNGTPATSSSQLVHTQSVPSLSLTGSVVTASPDAGSQERVGPRVVAMQLIVQILDTIVASQHTYDFITADHLMSLATSLETAYTFCHYLVVKLSPTNASAYKSESLVTLESTEFLASTCYLRVLLLLATKKDASNLETEHLFIRRCYMFISRYLKRDKINKRVIVQILQAFLEISDTQFSGHLGIFCDLFIQLMMDDSAKIRRALKPVWLRIGHLRGGIHVDLKRKQSLAASAAAASAASAAAAAAAAIATAATNNAPAAALPPQHVN